MELETEFKSFKTQMFKVKVRNNILTVLILYIYTFLVSNQIDFATLFTNKAAFFLPQNFSYKINFYTAVTIILLIIFQLILGTIIHSFFSDEISSAIDYEREKIQDKDFVNNENAKILRTLLVKKISKYPLKTSIEVGIQMFLATLCSAISFVAIFEINYYRAILIFVTIIFGVMQSALVTYISVEKACGIYTKELVSYGISDEIIKNEHFWGLKTSFRIFLHFVIPIASFFFYAVLFMFVSYKENINPKFQIAYLIIILIVNNIYNLHIGLYFTVILSRNNLKMHKLLKQFKDKSLSLNAKENIPLTFTIESDYSIYLITKIIQNLQNISQKSSGIMDDILKSTEELSLISEKSEVLINNKEYEAKDYLELIKSSVENIEKTEKQINQISLSSDKTQSSISQGLKILKDSDSKIKEIILANQQTVKEINLLGKNIDSIFEIITTLERIAEQTRVLAFNAEIEISSDLENGEKFHIITNEVRSLVSTITNSIQEIVANLKAIQDSSDNLIISSEAETQKIFDGNNFIESLSQNFDDLKISSEIEKDNISFVNETTKNQIHTFRNIQENLTGIALDFSYFSNFFTKINQKSKEIYELSLNFKTHKNQSSQSKENQTYALQKGKSKWNLKIFL